MAEPDFAEFGHNLPYSLEAEQSVLGSILLNADLLSDVAEKIKSPALFYTSQHQAIYGLILQMFSESVPVDFVTLLERVKTQDIFDSDQSARAYLLHLMDIATTANLDSHCAIIA